MDELPSLAAVIEIANAASWVRKRPLTLREVLLLLAAALVSVSSLHGQSAAPVGQPPLPRAIYAPKPAYRAEWAKQGLTGKGVVLVTIDRLTGKVTGTRMLTSTGNQQLDGAALQAYSQWRFDPRTVAVSQLKIPIEFAKRPAPQPAKRTLPQPVILLIVLAIAGAAIGFLKRRRA
jgi:TonB family protein